MTQQEREQRAIARIDETATELVALSSYLHEHPELGGQEQLAMKAVGEFLEDYGFTVTTDLSENGKYPILKTALRADAGVPMTYDAPIDTASTGTADLATSYNMAFLGEYDALPGLGHGCGHNLIAMMSVGAALGFKEAVPEAHTTFFGCPAEETVGGKVFMSEAGLFKPYKAALIIHPGGCDELGGTSLATHPLEVTFHGRSAHVASLTDRGINALDAAVLFYRAVMDIKIEMGPKAVVGAIFTDAGKAPNVIPDTATVRLTVRAHTVDYLENTVLPDIRFAAQDAADQIGASVDMHHYEPLFKEMREDLTLRKIVGDVMTEFGHTLRLLPEDEADGSTDVGNVSHDVPTVQPTLNIGNGLEIHTPAFTDAAGSSHGYKEAVIGAKIMAVAAIRYAYEQGFLTDSGNPCTMK